MKTLIQATLTVISLLLISCSRETVLREELPQIFPDYIGVTVPAGVAPLNFDLPEEYSKVFAKVSDKHGRSITAKGSYAGFNVSKWHKLTESNVGDTLAVTVAGVVRVKDSVCDESHRDSDPEHVPVNSSGDGK